MSREAQKEACKRYYYRTKEKKKAYLFRFDKDADADLIKMIDSQPNKAAYIKELVRRDIDG